jgi:hypothetical protein
MGDGLAAQDEAAGGGPPDSSRVTGRRIRVMHTHPVAGHAVYMLALVDRLPAPDHNYIAVQVKYRLAQRALARFMAVFAPQRADGYYDTLLVMGGGTAYRMYKLPNWRQFPRATATISAASLAEIGTVVGTRAVPESTDVTACAFRIPASIRLAGDD